MKILDIGANNGDMAKKLCKSGSFVVAVEASPMQNPNLNGYNIVWENKAVSDSCNPVVLHLGTYDTVNTINSNWLSQGRFANYSTGKTITVDATTIDLLWDKYNGFDHIKIDVEGYEDVVLRGMKKCYGCPIQFEYASEWVETVTIPALKHILSLGYTKFNVKSPSEEPDWDPYDLPDDYLTYNDLLIKIAANIQTYTLSWGMILVRK